MAPHFSLQQDGALKVSLLPLPGALKATARSRQCETRGTQPPKQMNEQLSLSLSLLPLAGSHDLWFRLVMCKTCLKRFVIVVRKGAAREHTYGRIDGELFVAKETPRPSHLDRNTLASALSSVSCILISRSTYSTRLSLRRRQVSFSHWLEYLSSL